MLPNPNCLRGIVLYRFHEIETQLKCRKKCEIVKLQIRHKQFIT
jgi:hypothetical protein